MAVDPVFRIAPTSQSYDWGKVGDDSKVAQLSAGAGIPGFTVKQSTPYAELWMGTHTKSPSGVIGSSNTLPQFLAHYPQLIGKSVSTRFDTKDGNLPFLFKVLAIEKALSIQTHPDKETSEQLHATEPDIYKDPNHKPEMALALTPFKALCGFMPLPSIQAYLHAVPEFAALIPPAISQPFLLLTPSSPEADQKKLLRDLFAALMTADADEFQPQLAKLVARYETASVAGGAVAGGALEAVEECVRELVLTLNEQFPGDIGVFCVFVLNYVTMAPGEAIFLGAGEPHAYVSGDIMECMANSDNVIRAGLTPKMRDVPNLVSVLTYAPSAVSKHMVQPTPFAGAHATLCYDPPVPDFTVLQTTLAPGEPEAHRAIAGPSIAIVVEGAGAVEWEGQKSLDLHSGNVIFIGAGTPVNFSARYGTLVVYRAFVEV
ncbi:mannose-6-phosphate isomerase [Coniophora puteana RWD-64-598 SS2]|uniref:Mannose-6-phosphate isomerase n=1 Tax=Coniophora puteana (strain RWD-64-598) TaxID=741705 RepID=A0A5M3MWE0_CONPW|nr:mannose-6-phosphate isomerase [Coniophora puteana RWD-64-598 SS2]EIW83307.1 mannose-6-phosphate isomerase [Coniophora puteana RWD-64-598 SS2]